MSEIKEIYAHPWDFSLYEVDAKKVLTVIFLDRVDYPRSFHLLEDEENLSEDDLKKLSETIRKNYDTYKDREISPPVFQ